MFAYAHRYNCHRILLLYPQTADMPHPLRKSFTLDGTEIKITAATLNLTTDLTTPTGRNSLAKEIHGLLTATTNAPSAV